MAEGSDIGHTSFSRSPPFSKGEASMLLPLLISSTSWLCPAIWLLGWLNLRILTKPRRVDQRAIGRRWFGIWWTDEDRIPLLNGRWSKKTSEGAATILCRVWKLDPRTMELILVPALTYLILIGFIESALGAQRRWWKVRTQYRALPIAWYCRSIFSLFCFPCS